MARPREFEIDQALRDAAEVFRLKGYHSASLDDLTEGTGLAKGSLYKAFHDKKSLFLGALDLYARESHQRFAQSLEGVGSGREAIRQALVSYLERALVGQARTGCLITNTAIEIGAQDEDIGERVRAIFGRRTQLFEAAVRRAQAAGEIATDRDPRQLAEFFELTVQGLRVLLRAGFPEADLRRTIDTALSVLG